MPSGMPCPINIKAASAAAGEGPSA